MNERNWNRDIAGCLALAWVLSALAAIGQTPTVAAYIRAKLSDLRRQRGLTAAQLGRAAGLSPAAVANIERGESDPALGTLCALADALGVAPRDLLPDPEKKTPKNTPKKYSPAIDTAE